MRFGKATCYTTCTVTFRSKNNAFVTQIPAFSCQKGFEIVHITTIGKCTGCSTRSIDQRVAKMRESLIFEYGAVLCGIEISFHLYDAISLYTYFILSTLAFLLPVAFLVRFALRVCIVVFPFICFSIRYLTVLLVAIRFSYQVPVCNIII